MSVAIISALKNTYKIFHMMCKELIYLDWKQKTCFSPLDWITVIQRKPGLFLQIHIITYCKFEHLEPF